MDARVQQYSTAPPNYNIKKHAQNGFSHLPSIAQIISYISILFTLLVYFTCTISLLPSLPLLIIFIITTLILLISSAIATICDPTDRVVYYYKWSRHDKKIVFSPQYDKVLFCQFCDSYCRNNSKHCRTCNRCVDQFDHHCMWFNNCVGNRNYKWFAISITSTFVYAVIIIVHVVLGSVQTDFQNGNQVVKIVFSWIAALLMAVFGFLLFNLIALHVYLWVKGLTTYQFLQLRKKEEEEERKKVSQSKQKVQIQSTPIRIPNNKVMPIIASETVHKNIQAQQSYTNLTKIMVTGGGNEHNNKTNSKSNSRQEEERSQVNTGKERGSKGDLRPLEKESYNEEGQKDIVFQEAQSQSLERSRIEENRQRAIASIDRKESQQVRKSSESLHSFFRQNRSLKFLLPAEDEAQSPLKHRKKTVGHFQAPHFDL